MHADLGLCEYSQKKIILLSTKAFLRNYIFSRHFIRHPMQLYCRGKMLQQMTISTRPTDVAVIDSATLFHASGHHLVSLSLCLAMTSIFLSDCSNAFARLERRSERVLYMPGSAVQLARACESVCCCVVVALDRYYRAAYKPRRIHPHSLYCQYIQSAADPARQLSSDRRRYTERSGIVGNRVVCGSSSTVSNLNTNIHSEYFVIGRTGNVTEFIRNAINSANVLSCINQSSLFMFMRVTYTDAVFDPEVDWQFCLSLPNKSHS